MRPFDRSGERRALAPLLLVSALLLLPAGTTAADAATDAAAPGGMPLAEKVPVPGGETYRLRFGADVSVNDTCPVAKRPLNPRMRPTWVNGRPVGFC